MILWISIALNVILVAKCLLQKNSIMALLAYLTIHNILPPDDELKALCKEAWYHMFKRD